MDRDLRRVLLVGFGLLIALFTGRTIVGALYDDAAAARQVSRELSSLRSGDASAEPSTSDRNAASARLTDLEDRLEAAIPQVRYALPDDFAVRAGDSPDLRYIEVLRREQDALVRRARFVGRAVPSNLGMPELNPTGASDVTHALRALHIVNRVVVAALDAEVDAVAEIDVVPQRRRRREDVGFVRRHGVTFEIHGDADSLRDTLAAVVEGEPYLAVDDVEIAPVRRDDEKLAARFTASAIVVDEEQRVLDEESDR